MKLGQVLDLGRELVGFRQRGFDEGEFETKDGQFLDNIVVDFLREHLIARRTDTLVFGWTTHCIRRKPDFCPSSNTVARAMVARFCFIRISGYIKAGSRSSGGTPR